MKILLPLVLTALVLVGIGWWNMNKLSDSDTSMNTKQTPDGTTETIVEPAEVNNGNGAILNLSGRGLTKVPATVFNQTGLIELNLSDNKLTGALQAEIRHLQDLKTLDLSGNQFTGVPAEIGQLTSLEVLDLSNNQLTGLPNELGNLSNLKQLNLSGNEYSKADLAIIKENLPATTIVTVD